LKLKLLNLTIKHTGIFTFEKDIYIFLYIYYSYR